jgi:hypothetical protein
MPSILGIKRKKKKRPRDGGTASPITTATSTQDCHLPPAPMLSAGPSAPTSAQPKSYVVQHSERNSGCVYIGGCVLPLMEVKRMQIGNLDYLYHQIIDHARVPVSLEALIASTRTSTRAKADSGILGWMQGIDECTRAYQVAFDASVCNAAAVQECTSIRSEIIRYANEICHDRQRIDRTYIMQVLHQRMYNYATVIAIESFEPKLRDPCNKMCCGEASASEDETQRSECCKTLRKLKRLLRDDINSAQKTMIGETAEAL